MPAKEAGRGEWQLGRVAGRLAGRSGGRQTRARSRAGAPIAYLLIAGSISLAIAIGAGYVASGRVGMHIAVDEALAAGDWIANTITEPNLTEALLAGDQSALDEFDRLVRDHVLSNGAVRVKLWSADGRIVYSDEPRLIGETFGLGTDEAHALRNNEVLSKVEEPDDPENRFEGDLGRLLQVYRPVRTAEGERLLFEVYFSYQLVATHSRHVWVALAPIIFASVLVLGIVHVPLALSMARYQQRHRRQREELLKRAIETSNLERRRVAADLHDGVIQDLAATSFRLAAAEDMVRKGDREDALDQLHGSADSIRASISAARALIVDIYPPNLRETGLEGAIAGLLDSAAAAGLATSFQTPSLPALTPEMELLTYRTVRESIHNTLKHAEARSLRVTISNGSRPFAVEIADDGNGFSLLNNPEDGHLGLRLLSDLAADLGAHLHVQSTPGQGTSVKLETAL